MTTSAETSTRFGRSAWIVALAALANAGLVLGASRMLIPRGSENEIRSSGVVYAVLLVGAIWSLVLATRGLRAGEPRPTALSAIAFVEVLVMAWCLMLWEEVLSNRQYTSDVYEDWRFEWFLPVILPFLFVASVVAFGVLSLLGRFLGSRTESFRGAKADNVRSSVVVWTVILLAPVLLPAPMFLLSVVRSRTDFERDVARLTPDIFRDPAERILHSASGSRAEKSYEELLRNGWATETRLLERTREPIHVPNLFAALNGLARRNREAAVRRAIELYKENPMLGQGKYLASARRHYQLTGFINTRASVEQCRALLEFCMGDDPGMHQEFYASLVWNARSAELTAELSRIVKKYGAKSQEALHALVACLPEKELLEFGKSVFDGDDLPLKKVLATFSASRPALLCEALQRDETVCRYALAGSDRAFRQIAKESECADVAKLLRSKLSSPDPVQSRGAYHSAWRLMFNLDPYGNNRWGNVNFPFTPAGTTRVEDGGVPAAIRLSEQEEFDVMKKTLTDWLDKRK